MEIARNRCQNEIKINEMRKLNKKNGKITNEKDGDGCHCTPCSKVLMFSALCYGNTSATKMMDPIFCNLSSYVNVESTLRKHR